MIARLLAILLALYERTSTNEAKIAPDVRRRYRKFAPAHKLRVDVDELLDIYTVKGISLIREVELRDLGDFQLTDHLKIDDFIMAEEVPIRAVTSLVAIAQFVKQLACIHDYAPDSQLVIYLRYLIAQYSREAYRSLREGWDSIDILMRAPSNTFIPVIGARNTLSVIESLVIFAKNPSIPYRVRREYGTMIPMFMRVNTSFDTSEMMNLIIDPLMAIMKQYKYSVDPLDSRDTLILQTEIQALVDKFQEA